MKKGKECRKVKGKREWVKRRKGTTSIQRNERKTIRGKRVEKNKIPMRKGRVGA